MDLWTLLDIGRRMALRSLAVRARDVVANTHLLSRFSDWVVGDPFLWGVGAGVVLVLLGLALNLAPIVVIAAGAAIGVLNFLHARRRGYCPLPAAPGTPPVRTEAE